MSKIKGAPHGSSLNLAYTCRTAVGNIYYAFNDTLSGEYLVLAADDVAPSVLAHASGRFDMDQMPPAVKYWLACMSWNIEYAINNGVPLYTSLDGASSEKTDINPLLATTWDQGEPYDKYSPATSNGMKTPTGCVATAMAQVMYYHKWPSRGTGEHSYTSRTNGFPLHADFGSAEYRWDLMQDHYGSTSLDGSSVRTDFGYDEASAEAVSTLMFHCGVSVDMDYDYYGSGASSMHVGRALTTYFSYDKGVSFSQKCWYSNEEWEEKLYNELSEGRPLYYSGHGDDGGHAFVCDGYQNGYFHFNWGWSGSGNGYYLVTGIDAMHPKQQDRNQYISAAFDKDQGALFGMMKPQDNSTPPFVMAVDDYCDYTIQDLSRNEVSHIEKGDKVIISFTNGHGIWNYSNEKIAVYIGAKFVNVTTGEEYYSVVSKKSYDIAYGFSGITVSTEGIPDGKYKVYPAFGRSSEEMQGAVIAYGTEVPVLGIGNVEEPDPDPDPGPNPDPNPDPDPNPGTGDTDITAYPNILYIESATLHLGETFSLPVLLKNEEPITSFQFDVTVPEGFGYVKDEYGDVEVSLAGERTSSRRHIVTSKVQEDGSLRILCYSPSNNVFEGNEGVVITIPVEVSENMAEGYYPVEFRNMHIVDSSLLEHTLTLVRATVKVEEGRLPGDINGDGVINIVDVTTLVNIIINGEGDAAARKAADVNNDGNINVVDVTCLVGMILNEN